MRLRAEAAGGRRARHILLQARRARKVPKAAAAAAQVGLSAADLLLGFPAEHSLFPRLRLRTGRASEGGRAGKQPD